MYNLIEDLSLLTTIPVATLTKLNDKAEYLICNDVLETKTKEKDLTEINLGIGVLQIKIINDDIKYRFIPDKKLEIALRKSLIHGENPMDATVESALVNRIINVYKSFL